METLVKIRALGCTSRIVDQALEWVGGLKIDQNEHVYDFWAHFIYIQFSKARNVYTFW